MVANRSVSVPGLVEVEATQVSPPPRWALLEQQLIDVMEGSVSPMVEKYAEKGGAYYFADDVDDLYERTCNWGLFYAMGANERVLELALQQWHAASRFSADDVVSRVHPRFHQQIHREYFNMAVPGASEWHHKGEGNMAFYSFALADPTISENYRRTKRFAAMYMDEDPEAPNYDPVHNIFRCPMQSSIGPLIHAELEHVMGWLWGAGANHYYGVRASLYPVVKDLEPNWHEDPKRRDEIQKLFDEVVLKGDIPNSLGATALITHAYLLTGEEKYKQWVLRYTEGWMERMRQNGGIMPDNVGPNGKIGEQREGQWWGGLYGWNSFVCHYIMFSSLTVAAECCLLLTGDYGYLEIIRSQIKVSMDNAITREDGQLLLPSRYGPNGWEHVRENLRREQGRFVPFRMQELAHLYHASFAAEDYDLIDRIRETDKERDWNEVPVLGEKSYGDTELARFQYYDGKNPGWPERILSAELQNAMTDFETNRTETRDAETLIADNDSPPCTVYTKGLTQVMMGAPQTVYTGGLLRATLRYFDPDRGRPGLPPDVVTLVDKLGRDSAGVHFVNLNTSEPRNLIVQAGAFGEHQFTELTSGDQTASVDSKYFAVKLKPGASVHVDVGMKRFAHQPTYAFPWHGDKIPVPYQKDL